jgi:hypothetical protein
MHSENSTAFVRGDVVVVAAGVAVVGVAVVGVAVLVVPPLVLVPPQPAPITATTARAASGRSLLVMVSLLVF